MAYHVDTIFCCIVLEVQINAVIALSVPPERRYYGDVNAALIHAVKSTKKVTDICEFKYEDHFVRQ